MAAQPDERRRELARIHCLKKELRLDDGQYRAMLWAVGRVDSSAQLDSFGRKAVIAHLESHRARIKGPRRAAPSRNAADYIATDAGCNARAARAGADREALMWKIAALAEDCRVDGFYVDGMAEKMFGINRYEWATPEQLRRIVAALVYHAKRQRKGAAA